MPMNSGLKSNSNHISNQSIAQAKNSIQSNYARNKTVDKDILKVSRNSNRKAMQAIRIMR